MFRASCSKLVETKWLYLGTVVNQFWHAICCTIYCAPILCQIPAPSLIKVCLKALGIKCYFLSFLRQCPKPSSWLNRNWQTKSLIQNYQLTKISNCVSYFFHCWDKISNTYRLRKESSVCRGFSSPLAGSKAGCHSTGALQSRQKAASGKQQAILFCPLNFIQATRI